MFDISFAELVLVAIVGLLVIGPKRLPEALRTLGLWLGRLRRSFHAVKTEIEKEIGMDDIRRQLHNEAVMDEIRRLEHEVRRGVELPEMTGHPADRNHAPGAPDHDGGTAAIETAAIETATAETATTRPVYTTPVAADSAPADRTSTERHG